MKLLVTGTPRSRASAIPGKTQIQIGHTHHLNKRRIQQLPQQRGASDTCANHADSVFFHFTLEARQLIMPLE
jgi:hypothetical protein